MNSRSIISIHGRDITIVVFAFIPHGKPLELSLPLPPSPPPTTTFPNLLPPTTTFPNLLPPTTPSTQIDVVPNIPPFPLSPPTPPQTLPPDFDIFRASFQGELNLIKLWYQTTPNASLSIRNPNFNDCTLLYTASSQGHIEIVSWLIEQNVSLDETQKLGSTALHGAAYNNRLDVCKLLVQSQASIDISNRYSELPIDNALSRNYQSVVTFLSSEHIKQQKPPEIFYFQKFKLHKTLLESWSNGISHPQSGKWQPHPWRREINPTEVAFQCASEGNLQSLNTLYEKNLLNVSVVSLDRHLGSTTSTTSGTAGGSKNTLVLSSPLKGNVGVSRDSGGATLLHVAAEADKNEVVLWLIERNANVNQKSNDSVTPLHAAAAKGNLTVCKSLVEAKADLHAFNLNGETPVDVARKNKKMEIVSFLKQFLPRTMEDAFSAASLGDLETVRLWLEESHGGVNELFNNETLLHSAAKQGYPVIVDWLLNSHANVNAQSSKGTPLHLAAAGGNDEVVKILLRAQADINSVDKDNMKPINVAVMNGHGGIIQLLDTNEDKLLEAASGRYEMVTCDHVIELNKTKLVKKYGQAKYNHILKESESFEKLNAQLIKKAVKVELMNESNREKFKTIPIPKTMTPVTMPSMNRIDYHITGARCFVIENLMTPEECLSMIKDSEEVQYSKLEPFFNPEYRNNERILFISELLADILFKRIATKLLPIDCFRIRPVGFGNHGTWKPYRLNECFKLGKYEKGTHFKLHMDGPWVPRNDESSIYTVVIYLSDNFEGGKTKFVGMQSKQNDVTISPKVGSALIFNHDILHEGQLVKDGIKYILRTEIMFRRVDTHLLTDVDAYERKEEYVRTVKLYHKSQKAEREGNVDIYTKQYLEALNLQVSEQSSVPSESDLLLVGLPVDVWVLIFRSFTASELCSMLTISKSWFDIIRDGRVWCALYSSRWSFLQALESRLQAKIHPSNVDWFGIYWNRCRAIKDMQPVVFDLGSHSVKASICKNNQKRVEPSKKPSPNAMMLSLLAPTSILTDTTTTEEGATTESLKPSFFSIESVVAKLPDIYDFHGRRGQWSRYFCGEQARQSYPNHIVRVIKKGKLVDSSVLPEIIAGIFYEFRERPFYHPVLVAEPLGQTNVEKQKLKQIFLEIFRVPSLCFVKAPCLVLFSLQVDTGVVISRGYEVGYVAAVVQAQVIEYQFFDPSENCNLAQVAAIIKEVIEKASADKDEIRNKLCSFITYSGGRTVVGEEFYKRIKDELNLVLGISTYTFQYNPSPVYDVVSGGSRFAMLGCFKAIIEGSDSYFHPDPEKRLEASKGSDTFLDFYNTVIMTNYYWFKENMFL